MVNRNFESEGHRQPANEVQDEFRGSGISPFRIGTAGVGGRDDIFFAAVALTRMPMTVVDPSKPDNPIIFANRSFLEMTGYQEAEVLNRNCRFLQGPDTDCETINAVRNALSRHEEISVEVLNYKKDGSSFWNQLFISPILDSQGRLLYYFGSQLDVSRRRDAEAGLRRSQRMEAIGQLTGGLAHDFNNLLQVIAGNLEMLAPRVETDERGMRILRLANAAVSRGEALTRQLLAFARKQPLEGRPVNLNRLVATLSELVEHTLGNQIRVSTRFDPSLSNCRVDPVQLELALLNLLLNARDAMTSDNGEVVISTTNETIDTGTAATVGASPAGMSA